MTLIRGSHFASFGPDVTFSSQLDLKWESPSQQKPLMCDSFSVIAGLLSVLKHPLAFLVAFSVSLYVAAITDLERLQLPGRSRGWLLPPVSLGLGERQLSPLSLCFVLSRLSDLGELISFLLEWSLKKSDWEEPQIFACPCFFNVYFWMAVLPPEVWGMEV